MTKGQSITIMEGLKKLSFNELEKRFDKEIDFLNKMKMAKETGQFILDGDFERQLQYVEMIVAAMAIKGIMMKKK